MSATKLPKAHGRSAMWSWSGLGRYTTRVTLREIYTVSMCIWTPKIMFNIQYFHSRCVYVYACISLPYGGRHSKNLINYRSKLESVQRSAAILATGALLLTPLKSLLTLLNFLSLQRVQSDWTQPGYRSIEHTKIQIIFSRNDVGAGSNYLQYVHRQSLFQKRE